MPLAASFNPEDSIENHIPADFGALLAELGTMPPQERARWRYAFVLLLLDTDRARFIELHRDGDTLHLVVETVGGDKFSVMRPPMSEETEKTLLREFRRKLQARA